jgi:excisionase family DNA binding protein
VAEPSPWDLPGTAPRIATTPTTVDLYAYHGGKGQLLTVKEAADRLKIGTWAIYRLCKNGDLAHVRIVDSIRIRPADLAVFVARHRGPT